MQDHLLFVNILTCLVVISANISHSLPTAHGIQAAEKAIDLDMMSHTELVPSPSIAVQMAPSIAARNPTLAAGPSLEAVTAIGHTRARALGADLTSEAASRKSSKTHSTSAAVDLVLVLPVPLLAVLQARNSAASNIASATWS